MTMEHAIQLIAEATKILDARPRLEQITVDAGDSIVVVGDTHGNIDMVKSIVGQFLLTDTGSVSRLLFLGDYVDRNENDIESINHILQLLVDRADQLILLRGNHEEFECNSRYGFYDNLRAEDVEDLYPHYERMFEALPIACHIQNLGIFCCHGMIPLQSGGPVSLKTISRLGRGRTLEDWDAITCQLLWNDPQASERASFPSSRGVGYAVGSDDIEAFMYQNGLNLVIRSHYPYENGYEFFLGKKVLSIFSIPHYAGINEQASVAKVNGDGTVEVLVSKSPSDPFIVSESISLL
jgi:diadenosine tetraphosphatase ApaH/serine/threonine PP2A family protein phosphatase